MISINMEKRATLLVLFAWFYYKVTDVVMK